MAVLGHEVVRRHRRLRRRRVGRLPRRRLRVPYLRLHGADGAGGGGAAARRLRRVGPRRAAPEGAGRDGGAHRRQPDGACVRGARRIAAPEMSRCLARRGV